MSLTLPSGFQITTTDPIDTRFSVADATARKGLTTGNVYQGLLVFQQSDNKLYKLINAAAPSLDASWLEVGGVATVNGTSPDANGNVAVSIAATYTGFSSSLSGAPSLQASASGQITASFSNGALWIVTGETNPARTGSNGETYIYASGSVGQWINVPNYSQNAADARYLVKSSGGTVSGNIVLDSGAKLVGTASWADNVTTAVTAQGISTGTQGYLPIKGTGNSLNDSVINQPVGTTNVAIGTTTDSGYKLNIASSGVSGSLKVNNALFVSDTGSLIGTSSWAVSASIALTASYVSSIGAGGSPGQIQFNNNGTLGGCTAVNYLTGFPDPNAGLLQVIGTATGYYYPLIVSYNQSDIVGIGGGLLNTTDVGVYCYNNNAVIAAYDGAGLNKYYYSNQNYTYDVNANRHEFTGVVSASQGITGSLFGTASWARNSLTASFLPTGTYNITSSWARNSLTASYGNITGSLFGTASYVTGSIFTSTNQALSASYAITASYALNAGGGAGATKASSASVASFGGTPYTSSVTFGTAFSNNNYAVTVTGEDARVWSIQSKSSTGFTINSNSDVPPTGPAFWIATPFNN